MDLVKRGSISNNPRVDQEPRPDHCSWPSMAEGHQFSRHDEQTLSSYYAAVARNHLAPADANDGRSVMKSIYGLCEVARAIRKDDKNGKYQSSSNSNCDSCRFVQRIDAYLYGAICGILNIESGVCLASIIDAETCTHSHWCRDESDEDINSEASPTVLLLFRNALGVCLLETSAYSNSLEERMASVFSED